jgi:hypothetical protein
MWDVGCGMWDVGAANNSQIEDDHFISATKIMFSGIWISAFAEMTMRRWIGITWIPSLRGAQRRSNPEKQQTFPWIASSLRSSQRRMLYWLLLHPGCYRLLANAHEGSSCSAVGSSLLSNILIPRHSGSKA